ncbi:MAG: FAD-dependent 5-carboxymethylaminomethyl-2-thiouridine(34) oxidoreductase MnmC, partial [Hyphomonadaceae bacterium]
AEPPLPEEWLRAQPDGLLHPRAGLVAPAAAIAAMTRAAEIRRGARVRTLERDCSGWIVRDGASEMLAHAGCVVLACGPAIAGFAQTAWLPLRYSRGQLDWAALEGEAPAHARAAGAYAAPFQNQLLFGATFDRAAPEEIPRADAASTARNRAALERLAPEAAAAIDDARMGARAALRVSAPDLGPIAGLAPDAPAWRERFDGLRQGRRLDRSASAPAHDGLYLLGALGARGFTLAPILAERVVSEICGEPQALDADVLDAVHPARFLARALKRGG